MLLGNVQNVTTFFEDDAEKQDRQTDAPIIDVEMRIYAALGVAENVLSAWSSMHDTWKLKSNNARTVWQGMRLTGQVTTALGNLITNMQVHLSLLKRNDSKISMVLFLGDDFLALCTGNLDC